MQLQLDDSCISYLPSHYMDVFMFFFEAEIKSWRQRCETNEDLVWSSLQLQILYFDAIVSLSEHGEIPPFFLLILNSSFVTLVLSLFPFSSLKRKKKFLSGYPSPRAPFFSTHFEFLVRDPCIISFSILVSKKKKKKSSCQATPLLVPPFFLFSFCHFFLVEHL